MWGAQSAIYRLVGCRSAAPAKDTTPGGLVVILVHPALPGTLRVVNSLRWGDGTTRVVAATFHPAMGQAGSHPVRRGLFWGHCFCLIRGKSRGYSEEGDEGRRGRQ